MLKLSSISMAAILISLCAACGISNSDSAEDAGGAEVSVAARLFAVTPADDKIIAALAAYEVPGVAVAEVRNCEPGPVRVFGKANLDKREPVKPMTVFEAASLSKPVFGYLVMSLVEDGIVDLDQPFAPEFAYPRITDQAAFAKLTPRMVLSHRTGLPNWVGNTAFFDRSDPISFVAEPGAEFTYSGEAYQILKEFVELKTEQTLGVLFTERLGEVMPNSTFVAPLPDRVAPSRGYLDASDPESGREIDLYADTYAAGSLVTTAEDYARFLGHVCSRDGLSDASYTEMLSAQSEIPDLGPGNEDKTAVYGLGWAILTVGEQTLFYHSGDNRHYQAAAAFDARTGDGAVYLTNGARGDAMIDDLIDW